MTWVAALALATNASDDPLHPYGPSVKRSWPKLKGKIKSRRNFKVRREGPVTEVRSLEYRTLLQMLRTLTDK